jgi:hypothetical protein
VVTRWHLENPGCRSVERPAATRPRPGCQVSSVASDRSSICWDTSVVSMGVAVR